MGYSRVSKELLSAAAQQLVNGRDESGIISVRVRPSTGRPAIITAQVTELVAGEAADTPH